MNFIFLSITFANPWAWYLLLIPLGMAVHLFLQYKKQYPTLSLSNSFALKNETSWKGMMKMFLPVIRVISICLLIVAIARPQSSSSKDKVHTNGIDIVLALDISTSMLEKDFSPNRMEAAKDVAAEFVTQRPNDRIGLVVFAGESFTQCPTTIDHNVVLKQIKEIKNGALEDGTAIGMGLATSVRMMKESTAKSKVCILLTDGVNTAGLIDPVTAIDIAKALKIKVYTIGVGTVTGNIMGIDEPLMKKIAGQTGGTYFRAGSKSKLKSIYEQINKLETNEIEVSSYSKKSEQFLWWAVAGAIAFLIELILRYTFLKSLP
ncbi:MAG: VWA domain-containing protein [Chitinophagales bacterium]|nr:VWA domain-containing protein [Chitinophagales bacterium]